MKIEECEITVGDTIRYVEEQYSEPIVALVQFVDRINSKRFIATDCGLVLDSQIIEVRSKDRITKIEE